MLEALAKIVKTAAREELLPRFAASKRQFKADGSIVTEADVAMQQRLTEELAAFAPQYRLLGEEMSEEQQQELLATSGGSGLWCLDPLDGTRNFASGIPYFCVSLGLLVQHQPVLGLIYDPIRDECFSAQAGQGAWLDGKPLRCRELGLPLSRVIGVVDFKRLPTPLATALVTRPPYGSQRYFGSGALEWAWLAAGRFQVYLHGRQKLWDYAAGALILNEAGGHSACLHGGPLYTPALPTRSAIAACDAALFQEWRTWLDAHLVAG
jgi:myo-inositol-1(or 4)-monophosphatase